MDKVVRRLKQLLQEHELDGCIIRTGDSCCVYIGNACLQVYAETPHDYLRAVFKELQATAGSANAGSANAGSANAGSANAGSANTGVYIHNVLQTLRKMKPERIGIIGLAGAGKDTVGAILAEHMPDYYKTSYAAPLRRAAAMLFGHSDESLKNTPVYVNAKAHRLLVEAIEYLGTSMQLPYAALMLECNDLLEQRSLSPRKFMQMLGAAVRRIDEDAFVKHLKAQPQRQIVCDVRFPNELCDVNILVVRPGHSAMQHLSEQYAKDLTDAVLTGVLPSNMITIVNDGTTQDLLFKLNGTKAL